MEDGDEHTSRSTGLGTRMRSTATIRGGIVTHAVWDFVQNPPSSPTLGRMMGLW